jgi:hypothetical protein
MVNCLEAENFKGRIWTTISEPWKIGKKEWVVLLDGYRGGFAVNYLEVVGFPQPKRTGIALIAKERERQINVEDWPPEHDDQLINGELSDAAAIYAMSPVFLDRKIDGGDTILREIWPFGLEWYKTTPGKRIRNLEKAGALIAAEIDRLLRMEEKLNDRNLG